MKNYSTFLTTLFITLCLSFSGISDVEAKRFGGARSFGGKSSFGSPFRRSSKSTSTRSASQQKAFNKNKASRQAMSRRGGFMGMLGGLAVGGLLGAMFFGGAFEGFNFMDILMFGGIAYLLFRLLASKKDGQLPIITKDIINISHKSFQEYRNRNWLDLILMFYLIQIKNKTIPLKMTLKMMLISTRKQHQKDLTKTIF